MKFNSEHYHQASFERMKQAKALYEHGNSYALSMYCSGVAVECMLRALRWLDDQSFDGRHDIWDLVEASRFVRLIEETASRKQLQNIGKIQSDVRTAIIVVARLWNNCHRYASEKRLESFLKKIGSFNSKNGNDPKKDIALKLFNSSQMLINQGQIIWVSRTK